MQYRFNLGDAFNSPLMDNLVQRYFPTIENFGENKGTDVVGINH
jgi:hypothetical protein